MDYNRERWNSDLRSEVYTRLQELETDCVTVSKSRFNRIVVYSDSLSIRIDCNGQLSPVFRVTGTDSTGSDINFGFDDIPTLERWVKTHIIDSLDP